VKTSKTAPVREMSVGSAKINKVLEEVKSRVPKKQTLLKSASGSVVVINNKKASFSQILNTTKPTVYNM
jgi:hypothetical protein